MQFLALKVCFITKDVLKLPNIRSIVNSLTDKKLKKVSNDLRIFCVTNVQELELLANAKILQIVYKVCKSNTKSLKFYIYMSKYRIINTQHIILIIQKMIK